MVTFSGLGWDTGINDDDNRYSNIWYLALVKSIQVDGIHIRFPESSIPQISAI